MELCGMATLTIIAIHQRLVRSFKTDSALRTSGAVWRRIVHNTTPSLCLFTALSTMTLEIRVFFRENDNDAIKSK